MVSREMADDFSHIDSITTAALSAPPVLLRAHLAVQRIGAAMGARGAGAMLISDLSLNSPRPVVFRVLSGHEDPAALRAAAHHANADSRDDPYLQALSRIAAEMHSGGGAGAAGSRNVRSFRREDLVPDETWYASPFVRTFVQPMDVDHTLACLCRSASNHRYVLAFIDGRWKTRPFPPESVDTLQRLMERLWPVLEPEVPDNAASTTASTLSDMLARLSPAQRELLPLVLSDLSEDEIAKRIHRSRHTVHSHIKGIYEAANVQSRLQLLLLWLGRQPVSRTTPDR